MRQLVGIVIYYMFGYLIFWPFLHETDLCPKVWVEENFNFAIYLWIFFFIFPLILITLGTEYIKKCLSDFKSLKKDSRWPLYILLFGLWYLMIGFMYLLFSYLKVSFATMIISNGLFITGVYLTFLSFAIAKKLQTSKS